MSGPWRVGVIGCGVMGAGFAESCCRAGQAVTVVVRDEDARKRGADRLADALGRAVRKGRISADERDRALTRISFATSLSALRDSNFVLEAVRERAEEKVEILAELDRIVDDPDAVLATNTSSIPIMKLASATRSPERIVGVHFFNPVQVMPLAELTGSLRTSPATMDRAESFVVDVLSKQTVRTQDRAGFLVNGLLVPYLMSAIRLLESRGNTADEIDRSMTLGCGHPMGPLALVDLIGLDVVAAIGTALYEETKEPLYTPPSLLLRMVEGGLLGRKAGQGFFGYAR
ncbi:3-hydroxybutyryl-CoA dehydrogenase [Cryptosporangium japonicum]|uniref:3-hydroxybutyryl-CoA dehydrogenase n=1 Tax=Cryptosporangium japonicum TaxID=80872 RepID=A0ABN0TJZ0_9ACTN